MRPVVLAAFQDELSKIAAADKEAALKEVVRLLAKDIPGTPRLIMKHRGSAARKALGEAAEGTWKRKVTNPMMSGFERGLKKLPEGKTQEIARKAAQIVADDPVGGLLTVVAPGGVTVPFAKRGLRKLINAVDPV